MKKKPQPQPKPKLQSAPPLTRALRARTLAARNQVVREMTALQRDFRGEVVNYLKQANARIAESIKAQPSEAQLWNLAALQRQVAAALADYGHKAVARAALAATQAWLIGGSAIDKPLAASGANVVATVGTLPAIDTQQLGSMRLMLTDKIGGIGTRAIDKINTQIGLTVLGTQTPFEAIKAVDKILGGDADQRATRIVRTELGRVFAAASQARLEQAASMIDGMQKQWRRSGKLHSRKHHDMADGQIVDWDQPFTVSPPSGPVKLMYPHDPTAPAAETINCGCVMLPWRKSWGDAMATPGKRAFSDDEQARSQSKSELANPILVRAREA